MATRFLTRGRLGLRPDGVTLDGIGTEPQPTSLFITGGIGDVIALSCFLDVPEGLDTVFYATRKRNDVQDFLSTLCPPTTRHVSVWDDWNDRWGWYSLPEFERITGRRLAATDWSIATVFRETLAYRGLAWSIGHPLSSIHQIPLPDRYAVFQPFSCDKRDRRRDFDGRELSAALNVARANSLPLVLLNQGDDHIPQDNGLINLQNQTNLFGSIDITLGASLYIGIDSAMSQVATKVLPPERLLIKSVNGHYYRHLHWYCAPHDRCDFVVEDPIPRLAQLDWSCARHQPPRISTEAA